jgi:hypothetical protein
MSKKGDFMSRSEIRAILCAGKIGIDSSIQAQRAGEVMSQNWRISCLFDRQFHRLSRLNLSEDRCIGSLLAREIRHDFECIS